MTEIYEVTEGWERWYTLDKDEAMRTYEASGESDKVLKMYRLELTAEMLVALLNHSGINLSEARWGLELKIDEQWLEA